MKTTIRELIAGHLRTAAEMEKSCTAEIELLAKKIIRAYKNGKKLFIFGNGGSAADSQHMAAELVGRFKKERRAFPAIALTTNTSILTALANDYDYDCVFARQLEASANKGDIALGISTSGASKNVIKAFKQAKAAGLFCAALTGAKGTGLRSITDLCIAVPSEDTARIQEMHILIIHALCGLVEKHSAHD